MNVSTGIVRRMDDLGRVVIPKEIRRIHNLKEGDPLEIFSSDEGITFRKYSMIGKIEKFASDYANSIYNQTGYMVIINDCDHVVSVAGLSKREYVDSKISNFIKTLLKERKAYISNDFKELKIIDKEDIEANIAFQPIIQSGEVIGSVILLSDTVRHIFEDKEIMLLEVAAHFLSNNEL